MRMVLCKYFSVSVLFVFQWALVSQATRCFQSNPPGTSCQIRSLGGATTVPSTSAVTCPSFFPDCDSDDKGTATLFLNAMSSLRLRCDKSYAFEFDLNVLVPVNAVNARISYCINTTVTAHCPSCNIGVNMLVLAPQPSVKFDQGGAGSFKNITEKLWFKRAAEVRNLHQISEVDSRTEDVDGALFADPSAACWFDLKELKVRMCFEELDNVEEDYSTYGDAIIDRTLRVAANTTLVIGGSLVLGAAGRRRSGGGMTNVTVTSNITVVENVTLGGDLFVDVAETWLVEAIPVTFPIIVAQTGVITGTFSSLRFQPNPPNYSPCQHISVEAVHQQGLFSVKLTLDSAACTTGAPTSKAPTSAAPTSKSPTSHSPTSKMPTSASSTSKQPTSKAPTSNQPTTKSPTSLSPTASPGPTSLAPTSQAPTSGSPTSHAPTSSSPTSHAPTSLSPTSAAPTSKQPTSAAPTSAAPSAAPVGRSNLGIILGSTAGAIALGVTIAIIAWCAHQNELKKLGASFEQTRKNNLAHDLERRRAATGIANSQKPLVVEL